MRIVGSWSQAPNGPIRPTVVADVVGGTGQVESGLFLIDTGADRTVFSAGLRSRLQLREDRPPREFGLIGVGGGVGFVVMQTSIRLARDDGRMATFHSKFAAFTDPASMDISILGRDVLDLFDVILSRRRDEVLLLMSAHRYEVVHG